MSGIGPAPAETSELGSAAAAMPAVGPAGVASEVSTMESWTSALGAVDLVSSSEGTGTDVAAFGELFLIGAASGVLSSTGAGLTRKMLFTKPASSTTYTALAS